MVDARRLYRAENQDISILESQSGNKFAVRGTQGDIYSVDLDGPSCECPDWKKRSPEDGCKHILKVKIELGIAEPSNSGKANNSFQDHTRRDPIESLHSRNKTAEVTSYQVEPGTYVTRSDSNQDRESSEQERSKTSESVTEQNESRNDSGDSPSTEGTPYVWPEREQIDDKLICNSCDHINEPDTIHCEECDTFLLEDDTGDDTPISDPDDALGEDVGAKTFSSEEELYESLEVGLDNAVIGTYMTIKEGIKILIRSMERVGILFGLMYIGAHSAAFLGFHTLLGVTAGVIWGILTFGYLTRHENTVVSQMV